MLFHLLLFTLAPLAATTFLRTDPPPIPEIQIGAPVIVHDSLHGILLFKGPTIFGDPTIKVWYGVCLTPPDLGKNDGTVLGKHYFDCDNMQGLFTEPHNVRMDDGTMSASSAVQAIDKIGSNDDPSVVAHNAVVVEGHTGPSGGNTEGGNGGNTIDGASGGTDGQEEAVGYASTDSGIDSIAKNEPMIATSSEEEQQQQVPAAPAPPRRPSQIGTGVTNAAAYLNALDKKIDVLVNQDDAEEVASHRELDVNPLLNTAAENENGAELDSDKVQLNHEDAKMITKMDAVADNVQEQQRQQQEQPPAALPGLYDAAQDQEQQGQQQQPEGYPQQQNVFQRL